MADESKPSRFRNQTTTNIKDKNYENTIFKINKTYRQRIYIHMYNQHTHWPD